MFVGADTRDEEPYACIRFLRIGGELGYRVVTWKRASSDRELIGYRWSLRGACELARRDRQGRVERNRTRFRDHAFMTSHGGTQMPTVVSSRSDRS